MTFRRPRWSRPERRAEKAFGAIRPRPARALASVRAFGGVLDGG